MEKQNKVSNKNNRAVTKRDGETNLGKKNNNECYTSMQDILNELSYWANLKKFEGKKIICPCDWDVTDDKDIYGIEVNYKEDPAEVSAFKSVKSVKIIKVVENPGTLFEIESEVETEVVETKLIEYELKEDEIEDFLKNKLTCNFVRTLTQNARRWGIKSITASGYNPAADSGIKFQDVDYSKYDICITNPPFSLYKEFLACVIDKIDFICLAPFLNRKSTFFGIPMQEGRAFIGYNRGVGHDYITIAFNNATIDNNFVELKVACDWITSFNDAQCDRNKNLKPTGVSYDLYKDEYKQLNMIMKDGTHPIKVPSGDFPSDYTGWMLAPINVLMRISFDEYEWYITNFKKYYIDNIDSNKNPFSKTNNFKTDHKYLDGSGDSFSGIVFRKKPKEESKDGTND